MASSQRTLAGVAWGLLGAFAFAGAGPFGKALFAGGWTPVAVAALRTGTATAAFVVPAVLAWRAARPDRPLRRAWVFEVVRYGILAVAGVQLFFYVALQYAAVAPVLLIEFLAPVLLVGWTWARTGRTPERRVLVGAALSVTGLALVVGTGGGSVAIEPLGVLWSLFAAACLASFFRLSDAPPGRPAPPPSVLIGGGLAVGSLTCVLIGVTGLLPWRMTVRSVRLVDDVVSWWVPLLGLVVLAAVLAYPCVIAAVRCLGSRNASFLALTEVLFGALVSWVLLGEQPGPWQAVGGIVMLTGIVVVQMAGQADTVTSTGDGLVWPDAPGS